MTDSEDHFKLETSEQRQARRQPNVNHGKPSTIVAWDPRLALELAMVGADRAMEVFERYKIDKAAAVELIQNPIFLKQLEQYKQEVGESGMSFRMKARVLAEDLLPEGYELAKDPDCPASVRADMIQWMTKIADLEPVKSTGKDVPLGAGGFSLQIVFAGDTPAMAQQRVAADQAVTIEHQP